MARHGWDGSVRSEYGLLLSRQLSGQPGTEDRARANSRTVGSRRQATPAPRRRRVRRRHVQVLLNYISAARDTDVAAASSLFGLLERTLRPIIDEVERRASRANL